MAVVEGGEPKIIENADGNRTTPSIVALSKAGERLVGLLAKRQAVTNPKNTIHGIKRLMGHRYDDKEVERDRASVPFAILKSDDGGVKVTLGEKHHRPEEISAMILQKLKKDAESKLGEKIEEAVITVPAYFDDSQRQATKDAGEIAGFKVRRIINEPTAAALAYGFNKKKNEKIAVYDFGGGTFDISVLEVSGDEEQSIEVKSTDGDSHMGGEDIDHDIIDYIAAEFQKESGINVRNDELALQRLKEAAEKAKHELSTATETEINIPFVTSDASGPKHLLMKMNRAALESIAKKYIDRSIEISARAVKASGFTFSDIDEVILVGGQTRMPKIQEAVKALFGKEPNRSINPDEVVAVGAAIQGGIFQGDVKDVLLLDVTPLSLGIETLGGVSTKVIEKNTTIPISRSQTFSTAADNQTSVEIHVLQGEREMANQNRSLGRFDLVGIPPAPRGVPQVEVTFDIDANGIVHVSAKDLGTGKEQKIRIESSSGLNETDIEKMVKEAEAHAEEDRKEREKAEARNDADSTIYTTEKSIKELGDKVDAAEKAKVEEAVAELRRAVQSDDLQAMKDKTEALKQASYKIAEEMYKKTAAQGGADGGAQGMGGDSGSGSASSGGEGMKNAEDVDYEVVDDDKK